MTSDKRGTNSMAISDERLLELENDLAFALVGTGERTIKKIIALLGNPPSFNDLTPEFYQELAIELQHDLTPKLESVFIEAGEALMTELSFTGVSTDVINEGAVNWARSYIPKLAGGLSRTTRQRAQSYITDFLSGNYNRRELNNKLGRIFSPARAKQIAITETTRAANEGQRPVIDELSSNEVMMRGIWQTARDSFVCPICGPLNGKKSESLGFETSFSSGGKSYTRPPAHVGCRCQISFEYDTSNFNDAEADADETQPPVKPQSETHKRFETWQDINDAQLWFKETYNVNLELDGVAEHQITIGGLKALGKDYQKLANEYPMVSDTLELIQIKHESELGNALGQAYMSGRQMNLVRTLVNNDYLDKTTPSKGGWAITNHNPLTETITHEFGHLLHAHLNQQAHKYIVPYYVKSDPFFADIVSTVSYWLEDRKGFRASSVSTYAKHNQYEIFAELFSAHKFLDDKDKGKIIKDFEKLLELFNPNNSDSWTDKDERQEATEADLLDRLRIYKELGLTR